MTEPEAMALKNEIEAFCRKHSLYRTMQEVRKPHLDQIKVEISIKVNSKSMFEKCDFS